MTHPYYQTRLGAIIKDFHESLTLAKEAFSAALPAIDLDSLADEIDAELEDIVSTLPWVGGDDGRMTQYFEKNAGVIALGRVLLGHGADPKVVGRLLQDLFLAKLSQLDEAARFDMGRAFMSDENIEALRGLAVESRNRENPGDFVYTFVEAGVDDTGQPFDFGLDYQECGFCKLCARTGDTDILPMICNMDEDSYALRGVRLTRTQTLAGGASHCNFRYSLLPEAKGAGPQSGDTNQ